MKEVAKKDGELLKVISNGWPERHQNMPVSNGISATQDGVIYKGGQVVVPSSLREEFLRRLHPSHQGQEESTFR